MLMTYDREPHVRRPFTSDPAAIASALFEVEKLSANGSQQDSERREVLREISDMEDGSSAASRRADVRRVACSTTCSSRSTRSRKRFRRSPACPGARRSSTSPTACR